MSEKKRVIKCPDCEEETLENVEGDIWVCHSCGFEVEDGAI